MTYCSHNATDQLSTTNKPKGTRKENKPTYWKKSDKTKSKSTFPDTRKKISEISKGKETNAEINMIEYQILHPDATVPTRATSLSAGYDLTPCEDGIIAPGERKKIPTGLAIALPPNCFGDIRDRSSVASEGLILASHTVDADYTGNIQMSFINLSNKSLKYKAHGKPLAQLMIIPFYHDHLQQIDKLQETER